MYLLRALTALLSLAISSQGVTKVTCIIFKHVIVGGFALAPVVFLGITAALPVWNITNSSSEYGTFSHCNSDGSFTLLDHSTNNLWSIISIFEITVFWGEFTFATAKFIDIAWDLVIGRVVQAVLAWITYIVSTKALTMIMEESKVSYKTFQGLAFGFSSLSSIVMVAGELLTTRGMKGKTVTLFLLFSSTFVLAFPTLASSMSGYDTNNSAFLADRDGDNIPWSYLVPLSSNTSTDWSWTYDNETYDLAFVTRYASCKPVDSHNWGFSFLLLFITLLLLSIWSLGTYILWLDVHLHSKLDRTGRQMGMVRASHDLVEAMHRDGTSDSIDHTLGEGAIRKKIVTTTRSRTEQSGMTYQYLIDGTSTTRWETIKKYWIEVRKELSTESTDSQVYLHDNLGTNSYGQSNKGDSVSTNPSSSQCETVWEFKNEIGSR